MSNDSIIYIILAGVLALAIALFQYIYKSKKRTKVYWLLTGLRFVTIFVILLLLINPKFDSVTYYNEKPNLVVAVDNSESVVYLKQDSKVKALVKSIKTDEKLNENFNVQYFTFGNRINASASLAFNEKQSNMALAFDRFSEVFDNSVAPIIMITDGNQTYGRDYTYLAKAYKQPVFPVILGDTTKFRDLKISQLNVNRYAYLKNKFPVELIATYEGNDAVQSELRITSGNATVFSKPLTFDKENTSEIISFNLLASRVGIASYKAELLPLENEKNTVNNYKNFAVEVIDQKTNVAIVSEIIHPDLGALKKAIESNEQRQATILSSEEYLKQSNDFQLVIVYQPINNFKPVFEELNRIKQNKFVIAGTETNWSLLNSLQDNYKQQVTNQTEEFQPALNQNYGAFIIDNLNFEEFPPVSSEFGETTFSVPYDAILYKTINGTQIDEPLLTTFEINNQREALLLGQGLWRWRAQSYLDEGNFNNFDNFMGKLVQYLSSNQSKTRLNVNYESFYNGNDNVIITAQYFNKNYEFDANTGLNITLKSKDTEESSTLPFVLGSSNYQVDLSGLDAGDYTFRVSAISENVSKSGELKILDYNVEQQFLNADVPKLKSVATTSEGKAYFIDDTKDLIGELINDSRFATIQKSSKKVVPLIDFKYLLALIALCLSAEWFIRKYNGLI